MSYKDKPPIRLRVNQILSVGANGDPACRTFGAFLLVLIILNPIAVILESVRPIHSEYFNAFRAFDIFTVTVFTIEYILRIWSCVEDSRYRSPVTGRVRYAFTPLAIVDLLAILPFYLAMITVDLRVLRVLRIFRLLLILKVARYSRTLLTFIRVFMRVRTELLFTLLGTVLILMLSASLMYFAEHDSQPEIFSSIPAAMWWSIVTLTTVGYGDIYPVTPVGKLLASFIAVFGIGMFALPTGLLGAAFLEEIRADKCAHKCPHCGGSLNSQHEDIHN